MIFFKIFKGIRCLKNGMYSFNFILPNTQNFANLPPQKIRRKKLSARIYIISRINSWNFPKYNMKLLYFNVICKVIAKTLGYFNDCQLNRPLTARNWENSNSIAGMKVHYTNKMFIFHFNSFSAWDIMSRSKKKKIKSQSHEMVAIKKKNRSVSMIRLCDK